MRRVVICISLIALLAPLASRANAPVDAGAEAELSGDWDGHAVVADASSAIDPADACEAASQDNSTTRPAEHHVPSHERQEFHPSKPPAHEAEAVGEVAQPAPRSLVARQGLMVPAAFLAAASALSSTIVLGLRGRAAKSATVPHDAPAHPAPAPAPSAASHAAAEPAAH